MEQKIKVFLFAYVNQVGAFNLNARTLSKYIDKEKFEVLTLSLSSGNLDVQEIPGVRVFRCFFPAKISNYLGILWGIHNSDVVFAQRGNYFKYVKFLLKLYKRTSFKRQGNLIDDVAIGSIAKTVGAKRHVARSFNIHTKVFAPCSYVGAANLARWDINYETSRFLPPLIDSNQFELSSKYRSSIEHVIFIGNDMMRKGILEYFELSRHHKKVVFHIVGREPSKGWVDEKVQNGKYQNIAYHGVLRPNALDKLLDSIDLHILPSMSEGFGKVTVEVAFKGIPSIIYDSYGAHEWLNNEEEGIIISSFDELLLKLNRVLEEPAYYQLLCKGLKTLRERFKVERRVLDYQDVITQLYLDR